MTKRAFGLPALLCACGMMSRLALADPLPASDGTVSENPGSESSVSESAASTTPAIAAAAVDCAGGPSEIVFRASPASEQGATPQAGQQPEAAQPSEQQSKDDKACPSPTHPDAQLAEARAYLVTTAHPGGTMMRQGPSVAIGRLHPEFVLRLARAIREARAAGLSEAGIFSAYRPPAFGVGGFIDKFNSLHSYGLAVDVYGIGVAASAEALLWHGIGARHGIVCPYGPLNPVEWNHCQPTKVTIVRNENPLRETITPDGPISLEGMFEVGNAVIVDPKDVGVPMHPLPATPTKPGIAAVAKPSSSRALLANVATRGTVIVISERLRAATGGKAGAKSATKVATKSGSNTASKTAAKPAPQKLADAYDAKRRTAFVAKGRERPALRLPKLSGETVGAWADKPVAPTVVSVNDGKRI